MAITATVTSTKIDITSTGGVQETWDDIVTAVNAVSAGTILGSGTSGDPYEVKGNREVEFSNGVKCIFVQNTYTEWNEITTSGRYAIDASTGSEIEIEDGCSFDVSGSSASQIYFLWYGQVTATGTSGNRITLNGMSRNYMYARATNNWQYVDITNNRIVSGYSMYFSVYSNTAAPACSLSNIRFYNSSGNNGYGMYFTQGDFSNWTISDVEIDGMQIGILNYGATVKLSNSTIKNCLNPAFYNYSGGKNAGRNYQTSKNDDNYPEGLFQPMMMFDNCTFQDNDLGVYTSLCYYNSRTWFKDCTFIGDTYSGTQDGPYSVYNAVVLWSGTSTFTDIDQDRRWGTDGTHLHGHQVAVTVQDLAGDPIENATVIIQQSEGNEWWAGKTNSSGQLKNVFGDDGIFIEKEESSSGVYDDWSDSIVGGRYHTVIATAPGYRVEQSDYEITEGKTLTITLTPFRTGATKIYDSTLYDSTIY